MKLFAFITFATVLGVAVFGFIGIACGGETNWYCCVADFLLANCSHNDPVSYINFHFDFLKQTSEGTVYSFAIAVLWASVAWVLSWQVPNFTHRLVANVSFLETSLLQGFLVKRKQILWHRLHECSPSFS